VKLVPFAQINRRDPVAYFWTWSEQQRIRIEGSSEA
jgi:hypothetical protein